jgi:hypothetical protein
VARGVLVKVPSLKREESPVTEPVKQAAARLFERSQRLGARAERARIGSNERRKCLTRAGALHAAGMALLTDAELRVDVASDPRIEGGWRKAYEGAVAGVRARERRAKLRAASDG